MKEMAGLRHHHHADALWATPLVSVFQLDHIVGIAVHKKHALRMGHGRRMAFVFHHRRGQEDQMVDVNALGNIGRHIATEGKARYREFGGFWMRRLCVGYHRQHILHLAHAIIVHAIAVAHATQIGQIAVVALFAQ